MFGKFGVPRPVIGSHPGAAGKPSVPHAGFVPFVMSLNASSNADEYNCTRAQPSATAPSIENMDSEKYAPPG